MRKEHQSVIIQEPPMQELRKQRSCLKRTCTTGCGCIVIFFIAMILLLQFMNKPRTKELKEVPNIIEDMLPLYDEANIDRITYFSGKEKHKTLEAIAIIPKVILSPIILLLEEQFIDTPEEKTTWDRLTSFITEPVSDQRDVYTIYWSILSAEPSFIEQHYAKELEKNEFITQIGSSSLTTKQVLFKKEQTDVILYIKDNPNKNGTDLFSITISIPPSSN
ncbi:MAG: hypothetical protein HOE80_00450 [Candidatus Magasanikbacteria bacterium]|jgi:hypothetical protein|nr:hypothetical protein [Candidatus Magasanikbacteria bacterium]MBT4071181.1 hypothetical protein [Candidatus Magasanikbacteria bacterium]